ncbi:MAG: Cbb3-type cytochrome oxidase component FixQ [Pseudomonadota bacterium]|jgi:cbb3-type cytochrome oxidase subunit 3
MIEFHSVFTLVSLLVFIGIVAYTYSKGQKKNMEAAAQIPLQDDTDPTPSDWQQGQQQTSRGA